MQENKILVCVWGATMRLATFVHVIKETPKSVLVEELNSRFLTDQELKERGLSVGYLQYYSMPTSIIRTERGFDDLSGKPIETPVQFRIFRKDDADGTERYVSMLRGFRKAFYVWKGTPIHEDHAD